MSACLEAAPPVAPSYPSTDARAARLAKFKREQRIVEYLNRGVSVVEIAAQVGLSEKRMRAVIREILARRMPHPPEEFVAIQLSRLNEALLVAYSAMSLTNLKAVDQVVKIVRELDRYGGAFAAEWARPEASRAEPGERSPAFGGALFCSAELGLQDYEAAPAGLGCDARPENPAQHLEKVESAPGFVPLAPRSPGQEPGEGEGWPPDLIRGEGLRRPPNASSAPHPGLDPGAGLLPVIPGSSPGREKGPVGDRPEKFPQHSEKVKSAPGIGVELVRPPRPLSADPVSTPDLVLSLLRSAPGRQVFRSCLSTLRAGTYGVAPLGGGDFPYPAPTGTGRPENLAQGIEKIDSAPGTDGLDAAGSGSLPSPLIPCPIRPGRFPMTFDGVGAC